MMMLIKRGLGVARNSIHLSLIANKNLTPVSQCFLSNKASQYFNSDSDNEEQGGD